MPKFPVLKLAELLRILRNEFGVFSIQRGKGSHRVYKRTVNGRTYVTVIQINVSEYRADQTLSILEQLGISRAKFLEIYNARHSKRRVEPSGFQTIRTQ